LAQIIDEYGRVTTAGKKTAVIPKAPAVVPPKPSLQAPVTPAPGMANAGTAPPFASGARVAPPTTTWPPKGGAVAPAAAAPRGLAVVPPKPSLQAPVAPAITPAAPRPTTTTAPTTAPRVTAPQVAPVAVTPVGTAANWGQYATGAPTPKPGAQQVSVAQWAEQQYGLKAGAGLKVDPATGAVTFQNGITLPANATWEEIQYAANAGYGQRVNPVTGKSEVYGPGGPIAVTPQNALTQLAGAATGAPGYGGTGGATAGGGNAALEALLRSTQGTAPAQAMPPALAALSQTIGQPTQTTSPALQALQQLTQPQTAQTPTQGPTQTPATQPQIGGQNWQDFLYQLYQSSTGQGQTAEQIAESQYGDIEYRRQQERANLEQEKQKALEAISAQYAAQGTWKSGLREQSEGDLEDKYQKALADINQRHDVARQQALGTAQQQLTQQQQWGYGAGSQLAGTVLGQEQWQQQFGLAQRPYSEMTVAERAQAALQQLPYQQMTAAQQTEAQLALQQLAQSRELGLMPYQQATAGDKLSALLQQQQMKQQGQQFQSQQQFALNQLAQESMLAKLPYGQMTAAQKAQLEQGGQQTQLDLARLLGYFPQEVGGVKAGTKLPTQTQAQGQKDVFLESVYAKLNAGQPLTAQEALAALGSSSYQAGAPQTGFSPTQAADEARKWYQIYADPMTPAAQKDQAGKMYQYYSQPGFRAQDQPTQGQAGLWQQPPQMMTEQQRIEKAVQNLKARGMSDAQISAVLAAEGLSYGQYGKKKVGGEFRGG